MFFKSKLFWVSAVLIIWAVVVLFVIHHQTKQPSEPIKVYKDVEPYKKQQPSGPTIETKQIRHHTAKEMDTTDTNRANLSENASHDTNAFTGIDDASQGTSNQPKVDSVSADELKTEAAYIAQKVAELRPQITQVLQERKDMLDMIGDLAEFGMSYEEPYALRQQLQKEAAELRTTIFNLCREYTRYTMDSSPFQYGGEFHDLMEQNHIGISIEYMTLEEIKTLESR